MMLTILFFVSLGMYFAATALSFSGMAAKSKDLRRFAWIVFLIGFALHLAYFIARTVIAGRLPFSNQFEFAMSLALGIALTFIILRIKFQADWISGVAYPTIFLLLVYAAFLPQDIRELMPALRSPWFGLHVGAAVISYAAFMLAGCAGIKYLLDLKKGEPEESTHLRGIDYLSYRLIALGMLMLTVVILSGAIWAEEAWSSFWTWDPKELWSLITWIVYAIYLHQRLRKKWQGRRMAVFSIFAVFVVLFTFIGVNTLLPGLHSYFG